VEVIFLFDEILASLDDKGLLMEGLEELKCRL